jgi:ABC-2 type transport system permease protein
MNKTFLIFSHEFVSTIRRTGFIIMTLAVPLVALVGIGAFVLISRIQAPPEVSQARIGFIDNAGEFGQSTNQGAITLVRFATPDEATRALSEGDVQAYFVIPSNYVSSGVITYYSLQRQLQAPTEVQTAIQDFLVSNLLSGKVPPATLDRVQAPLNLVTTTLTPTGTAAPEQGGFGSFIVPYIFSFLLLLSILFSSGYLLQGLGEEKEGRLMEILLSSVSARQLLTGKVLGLGAAGLFQVLVWVASAPLLLSLASATLGGFISSIQLPASLLVLAVVYFVLGYSFFAVLEAAVGAISPSTREGQQLAAGLNILAVSPLWFTALLIAIPDSPIWVILTIFPVTAPVMVMARLGLTNIPTWELATSIVVLALCTVGGLFLAAKVFRVYLLMYGKRPRLGEIIRSLRSA